ncbi:hypothetical protein OHT59_27945 [Streptomyces sp. NBC_00243]|uniref:hypothetical protein n=1 Tax=Streptomyces sp. NBC_00243 TaxID=2975688 RepID=UPI002DDBF75E|nr:hypothetical protein [Streptomyces sp. NBC_00243]WRZ22045.1 hypothetical protein OHT59_27945 [Streptomyces sp. NBC_00243]
MPLFRTAQWPRDHRDEVVAGALVGAVVIVLGYASGIGAPSGTAEAATPPASPPAATAPANPAAPGGSGAQDPGSGEVPSYGGVGGGGGIGTGIGAVDTGYGTGGTGSTGGTSDPGHSGHETSPPTGTTSPASTPTPSPTDPDTDTCEEGEVALVGPLLTGVTEPLFGVLNGSEETPEPTPTPCVGLAPVSVTGLLGISASPTPEATP